MQLSVIIPVKNDSIHLIRAIDSILNNEYPFDIEIIVVDDHSDDGIETVINKYKNRIKYYVNEKEGVSAARNTGLCHALGKYVMFMDSDDMYRKDTFLILNQMMLKNYDEDIILSGYNRQSDDESWIKPFGYLYAEGNGKSVLSLYLNKKVFTHLGALCFKRLYLQKNGILFDETLTHGEDLVFVAMAFYSACHISCTYREIYLWTLRKNSTLYKKDSNRFNSLLAVEKLRKYLENDKEFDTKYKDGLQSYYALLTLDNIRTLLWLGMRIKDVNSCILKYVNFEMLKPYNRLNNRVKKSIYFLSYFKWLFLLYNKLFFVPTNFRFSERD